MAFKLGYCALRWRNPDLEPALEALKKSGWGWLGMSVAAGLVGTSESHSENM